MRLGYTNEAIAWLEEFHRVRENALGGDPLIDDCWVQLRSDPRYKVLMEKMGFTKVIPLRE